MISAKSEIGLESVSPSVPIIVIVIVRLRAKEGFLNHSPKTEGDDICSQGFLHLLQ